jgi:hypothetical protein
MENLNQRAPMPRISRRMALLLTELVAQARKFFLVEQEIFTRFDSSFARHELRATRPWHLHSRPYCAPPGLPNLAIIIQVIARIVSANVLRISS